MLLTYPEFSRLPLPLIAVLALIKTATQKINTDVTRQHNFIFYAALTSDCITKWFIAFLLNNAITESNSSRVRMTVGEKSKGGEIFLAVFRIQLEAQSTQKAILHSKKYQGEDTFTNNYKPVHGGVE